MRFLLIGANLTTKRYVRESAFHPDKSLTTETAFLRPLASCFLLRCQLREGRSFWGRRQGFPALEVLTVHSRSTLLEAAKRTAAWMTGMQGLDSKL